MKTQPCATANHDTAAIVDPLFLTAAGPRRFVSAPPSTASGRAGSRQPAE